MEKMSILGFLSFIIIMKENIVRITDILEQVENLNKMIDFHQTQSKENSMMRQYLEMRNEFLIELKTLMSAYKIQISDMAT